MIVDEDVFLEHYGVPGMKWGRRKAQSISANRALNKASRASDRKKRDAIIDKSRATIESGKWKREHKNANKQYYIDKKNLGSREARKILYSKRRKLNQIYENSQQVKSGKETAKAVALGVGFLTLAAISSAAVTS